MSDSKEKQSGTIISLGFSLFFFCLFAALLLGLVYESTKDVIAEKKESVTMNAFQKVFGDTQLKLTTQKVSEDFEKSSQIEKVVLAENVGVALEVLGKGYKGDPIELVVGFSFDNGAITGVQIISHSETAGLGANATKPSFLKQFVGIDVGADINLVKGESQSIGDIDALSGATKTSRGVVDAVSTAREYFIKFYGSRIEKGEENNG